MPREMRSLQATSAVHGKARLCLPAGAFVSHEWTLRCVFLVISTANKKKKKKSGRKGRLCEKWAYGKRVHMLTQALQCMHMLSVLLQLRLLMQHYLWLLFIDNRESGSSSPVACVFLRNENVPVLRIRCQPTWLWMGNCWD